MSRFFTKTTNFYIFAKNPCVFIWHRNKVLLRCLLFQLPAKNFGTAQDHKIASFFVTAEEGGPSFSR